jgi:hypothetical protein
VHSYLRQSTAAQSRAIGPFLDDTDFKTAETGLTIANTDIKLVANGAASANKNSGGGTHRVNGVYGVTFDATDSATVGELFVSVVVAGALPVFATFVVLEEAVYDMLFAASAIGYIANQPVDLNTIKTQTVTCAGGVTVPAATLASTTNITAGTITTVTNLTNAPTAGDFTATMKTSIGTAVAASAVASVTGNVGGNVIGSIGSLGAQAKLDVNAEADTAITDAALATAANLATVDTVVDAIKAKTDSLTFTVAGTVDSNITHVIADSVQVNGADDTNWGGAP